MKIINITIIKSAATIQPEQWERAKNLGTYTRLEQLFILAIQDILSHSEMNLADEDCGLILSTTKGNIDLLANHPDTPDIRVHLWEMGRRISEYFQAGNPGVEIISQCLHIRQYPLLIVAKRWN